MQGSMNNSVEKFKNRTAKGRNNKKNNVKNHDKRTRRHERSKKRGEVDN